MQISLDEWSIRLGLYTSEEAENGEWFGRDIGPPTNNPKFEQHKAWKSIVQARAPAYKPTSSRAEHVADPVLRLAQVFLGYNLLGQANTSASVTRAELYFMWCMKEQRKVHLGYWIAHTCHKIATFPVRHLNICNILGVFVRNNLDITFVNIPTPSLCLQPELFDIAFFRNVRIMSKKGNKLQFYDGKAPDLQIATVLEPQVEDTGDEDEDTPIPARRTWRSGSRPREEPVEAEQRLMQQMATMIRQIGLNTIVQRKEMEAQRKQMEAQSALMTRAVNAIEQIVVLMTEHFVPQQPSQTQAPGSNRPESSRPQKPTDPKKTQKRD